MPRPLRQESLSTGLVVSALLGACGWCVTACGTLAGLEGYEVESAPVSPAALSPAAAGTGGAAGASPDPAEPGAAAGAGPLSSGDTQPEQPAPSGLEPAAPSGLEPAAPSGGACAPGTHACGGSCVSETSPLSCGRSCLPCPIPENGTATCVEGLCGVSCLPDFFFQDNDCHADAVQVAAGRQHSCAVLRDGHVRCWGDNTAAQLGAGSDASFAFEPLEVVGVSNALQVVAGAGHNCILLQGGSVSCWGDNTLGQLGTGSTTSVPVPVPVPGVSNATRLGAGANRTCALLQEGRVSCWGPDGSESEAAGTTPTELQGLAGAVSDFALGSGVCVVLTTGAVQCLDSLIETGLPTNASAVRGGASHFCAVVAQGRLQCWGGGLLPAALGEGEAITVNFIYQMVSLAGLSAVSQVATGFSHSCALSAGAVQCWGTNDSEELGNDTIAGSTTAPLPVFGISGATSIESSSSARHTCAILEDGSVSCWGWNSSGQLGRQPGEYGLAGRVVGW